MSENTAKTESLIVLKRIEPGTRAATRKIALDRFPHNEDEVQALHDAIDHCDTAGGTLTAGWGEVSYWATERVAAGNWAAGVWRSTALAAAGHELACLETLTTLQELGLPVARNVLKKMHKCDKRAVGSIPVAKGVGQDSQTKIVVTPNEYRRHLNYAESLLTSSNRGLLLDVDSSPASRRPGHLLLIEQQNASSARLTAIASEDAVLGEGWMPSPAATVEVAKALAVFLNSTAGRLQFMCRAGDHLGKPRYRESALRSIRVPPISNVQSVSTLAACWEETKTMEVPRYDEGECEVRKMWDKAVSEAMGGKGIWDYDHLTELRLLLHREPHVCGKPYGHYSR